MAATSTTIREFSPMALGSCWAAGYLLAVMENDAVHLQDGIRVIRKKLGEESSWDPLEQERRELLNGLLEELSAEPDDDHEVSKTLLKHLSRGWGSGLAFSA